MEECFLGGRVQIKNKIWNYEDVDPDGFLNVEWGKK